MMCNTPEDLDLKGIDTVAIDIETYDPNLKTKGSGAIKGDGFITGVAVATGKDTVYFPLNHSDTTMKEEELEGYKKSLTEIQNRSGIQSSTEAKSKLEELDKAIYETLGVKNLEEARGVKRDLSSNLDEGGIKQLENKVENLTKTIIDETKIIEINEILEIHEILETIERNRFWESWTMSMDFG